MSILKLRSPNYNLFFDRITGVMARWGKTLDDDPKMSPFGPELLDIEISKNGCPNATRCAWCYKENTTDEPTNMSLEDFKNLMHKFRDCQALGQIALGLTGVQTNPDLIPIMKYCRSIDIVPNLTMTGKDLTPELADNIADLAGAIAISVYPDDKDLGYRTIKQMSDLGLKQVNMHLLVSKLTLDFCMEVLSDIRDKKVPGLQHVVLLSLKPKGRGQDLQVLTEKEHEELFRFALDNKIPVGMDSCSASRFVRYVEKNMEGEQKAMMLTSIEPCESTLFSAYINVDSEFVPCSFCEDKIDPVDMKSIDNFLTDIWSNDTLSGFRQQLQDSEDKTGCRECPVYPSIR